MKTFYERKPNGAHRRAATAAELEDILRSHFGPAEEGPRDIVVGMPV